jgi:hypothetical protein
MHQSLGTYQIEINGKLHIVNKEIHDFISLMVSQNLALRTELKEILKPSIN